MTATRIPSQDGVPRLLADVVGSRPAANTVPSGTWFYSTDEDTIYRSDGSDWSDGIAGGDGGSGTTNIVALSGPTQALAMAAAGSDTVYDVTMDEDCTFSFTGASSGTAYSVTLILSGAFTPTFPAAVVWPDGTAPTYGAPSIFEFLTTDGGTTVYGMLAGKSFS